jgi:hypothetical protein
MNQNEMPIEGELAHPEWSVEQDPDIRAKQLFVATYPQLKECLDNMTEEQIAMFGRNDNTEPEIKETLRKLAKLMGVI